MKISKKQFIILIVLFFSDLLDWVSDWSQFSSIYLTKAGLVFGEFEKEIVFSAFAFSIVGTLTFTAEIVSYCYEYHGENVSWGFRLLFITTWLEDVPQIIITARIASCRQEAISVIQLISASIAIVGAFISFCGNFRIFYHYYNSTVSPDYNDDTEAVHNDQTFGIAAIPGLFIMVLGAVLVFIFTNVSYDLGGKVELLIPEDIVHSKFHSEEYINGTGVFLHIDDSQYSHLLMPENTWMKIADMEQIGTKKEAINIRIDYNFRSGKFFQLQQMKEDDMKIEGLSTVCYQRLSNEQQTLQKCSDIIWEKSEIQTIILQLKYRLPDDRQVLGDILYNYKVYEDNNCNIQEYNYDEMPELTLKYFKDKSSLDCGYIDYLTCGSNKTYHYFHGNKDLIDIKEVWRTGYFKCACQARDHPMYDPNLNIPCF